MTMINGLLKSGDCMCGRYLFSTPTSNFTNKIKHYYQEQLPLPLFEQIHFGEVRPTDKTIVFVQDKEKHLIPHVMRWGMQHKQKIILNFRTENKLAEKYTPCLIIGVGYYEWTVDKKQKYFFSTSNQLICMAGCYNDKNEFAILTEEANPMLAMIHHRVPLTIKKDEINAYFIGHSIHSNQNTLCYSQAD